MGKSLVIVESPAKARTIEGYLGSDYAVGSSVGHVRDLPDRAKDVPEAERKRFGALGVDVQKDFEPYYVVDPGKKKIIAELKKRLADADELLLATDEDREGEAIAWHLVQVLKPKVPVRRMVFHEITKDAITRALAETRSIDDRLVDAQETRRILDRLYGYEVSPVLWKKVTRGLSAGRVQSVATRLVVDRERERMAVRRREYWDLLANLRPWRVRGSTRLGRRHTRRPGSGLRSRRRQAARERSSCTGRGGRAIARGRASMARRSGGHGRRAAVPASARSAVPDVDAPAGGEQQAPLLVSDDDARGAASVRVGLHHLHAHGLDDVVGVRARSSTHAGPHSSSATTTFPREPRHYERAVANAQEAHEAIRPAGDIFRTPEELEGELKRDELALYDLVWKRTARVPDGGRPRPDRLAAHRCLEHVGARTSSSRPREP